MKKILFITAFPPNNQTAGQNYTKKLIEKLAKGEYKVDIICFSYKNHETYDFGNKDIKYIKIVKNSSIIKIMNSIKIFLVFSFFSTRFSFKVLKYIHEHNEEYEFIYLDFSQTFLYGLFIPKTKKYLMAHDIIIQKYKRSSKNFLLNFWVKYSEKLVLSQKNAKILCFSNKDLNLIKEEYKLYGEKIDFFIDEQIKGEKIHAVEDYFCFYGAWGRKENLEGLEWFEKRVIERLDFKIKIIGGGIKEDYKGILCRKGFEILGFVENPYEILLKSKGLIAPLFNGAGVKVKVIEALSCGTPIIGTEVALEGIEIESKFIKEITTFEEIIQTLLELKKITINDKIELQSLFFKEYGRNTFLNVIKEKK